MSCSPSAPLNCVSPALLLGVLAQGQITGADVALLPSLPWFSCMVPAVGLGLLPHADSPYLGIGGGCVSMSLSLSPMPCHTGLVLQQIFMIVAGLPQGK